MAGLFESHDQSRIETFAYASDRDDGSAMRQRLRQAFAHWRDIRALADDEAARHIGNDALDVLVDLKGHTHGTRIAVLARRPAPVQLHYLGFPGTHCLRRRRRLYRGRDRRACRLRAGVRRTAVAASGLLSGERRSKAAPGRRGPQFGRAPRSRTGAGMLQPDLQANRAVRVDLARRSARTTRRGAVAVGAARARAAQSARVRAGEGRGGRAHRVRTGRRTTRSTWRGCGAPISRSTFSPTDRTRREATRCGRACRCSRAAGPRSPGGSAPVCATRRDCRNWSPNRWRTTRRSCAGYAATATGSSIFGDTSTASASACRSSIPRRLPGLSSACSRLRRTDCPVVDVAA